MSSDEEKKATIIERLQNIEGSIWFGYSSGYGIIATIYMIGDDGLYTPSWSLSEELWHECIMSKEDYEEANTIIAAGGDEYDHYQVADPVVMVQNGCMPEKTYYVLNIDDYRHPDIVYFESLDDALECVDFDWFLIDKWEDMGISALEYWDRVAGYLEKGITSVYAIKS